MNKYVLLSFNDYYYDFSMYFYDTLESAKNALKEDMVNIAGGENDYKYLLKDNDYISVADDGSIGALYDVNGSDYWWEIKEVRL